MEGSVNNPRLKSRVSLPILMKKQKTNYLVPTCITLIFSIFAASLGLVPQGPYTPLESVSTSQLSTLTRNTLYSKHWISIEPENYYILSTTPIWTEYRSTSGTDTSSGEQIRVDFYPIQIRNENNESFVLALETSNDDHVTNYLYGTRTIQGTLKDAPQQQKDTFDAAMVGQNAYPYFISDWRDKTTYEPIESIVFLALGVLLLCVAVARVKKGTKTDAG